MFLVFVFKKFVLTDGGCPPPSYEPGNAVKAEYQATRNL